MKARYHIKVHCGDDGFQGPAEVQINETLAAIRFQKNSQGPGMLDIYIDLAINPKDVRCENTVLIPPDKSRELEDIALYITDVLAFQTGRGDLLSQSSDAFEKFLPENDADRRMIEGKRTMCYDSISLSHQIYGGHLISVDEFKNFYVHRDALSCYAEASRLRYPISKYRELYRVIEYYFRVYKEKPFIERTSAYLSQFDAKYDKSLMGEIYKLRTMCSHTIKRDSITPNKRAKLDKLQVMIPELEAIAKILLKNPPPEV